MDSLIEQLLIKNNYFNFSKKDIFLQLMTHPNYPTFLSITDTLSYFGIDNLAAKVPVDALSELPSNFLSSISESGSSELVLVSKKEHNLQTRNNSNVKKTWNEDEFLKVWENYIIAVEPVEKTSVRLPIRIIGAVVLTILLVTLLTVQGISFIEYLLFLFSGLGLSLGILLVKEKIGEYSATVSKVCNVSPNTNCNDVINSEGAKLFNILDMADASFIFFGSILTYQVFFGWDTIMTLILISSLPVLFYSIYYQAVNLKKWCILCLGVSGVLITLTLISVLNFTFNLMIIDFLQFILITTMIAFAFFFGKSQYTQRKKLLEENISLIRFKRNPEIFNHFFEQSDTINSSVLIPGEIILGNLNAPYQITVLTNPFCGFCKDAFKSYLKIIQSHSDDIKIILRFNGGIENLDNPSTKISARLIELYHEKGKDTFAKIYTDWFENRDIISWLKRYGEPEYQNAILNILKNQEDWGKKNNLTYTPATVLNKTVYPKNYSYEDLQYFISEILEFEQNEKQQQLV